MITDMSSKAVVTTACPFGSGPDCSRDIQPTFTENSRGANETALFWLLLIVLRIDAAERPAVSLPRAVGSPRVALPSRVDSRLGMPASACSYNDFRGQNDDQNGSARHGIFMFLWLHAQWGAFFDVSSPLHSSEPW